MSNNIRIVCGVLALLLLSGATTVHAQADAGDNPQSAKPAPLTDEPTDAYRLALLDLAWKAATSYPLDPHIKNRGAAEESVVLAALKIDQPQLAWTLADQVVDWRRGMCYAQIAHYLLDQDQRESVVFFLQQAIIHCKNSGQDWRENQVKARVAQARIRLGQADLATDLLSPEDVTGISASLGTKASLAADADFDSLVEAFDRLVATQGYDAILGAMYGYAELYDRYYADESRRTLLRQKITAAGTTMPGLRRFEVMLELIDSALKHDDAQGGAALVDEADALRRSFSWSVDQDLLLRSEVARFRARLGQADRARAMLDESLTVFEQGQESLESFYRAGALRPIAECYAMLGDSERAHAMYERVVELGAVNPNLRPRISDITASCVSMAVHGITPDAELLSRIQDIVSDLGH